MVARDGARHSSIRLLTAILSIGGLLIVLTALRRSLLIAQVRGASMAPSYMDGDHLVAVRLPLWRRARRHLLVRNAVVLVSPPGFPGQIHLKRITGVPGDSYRVSPTPRDCVAFVPRGHYFLEGDGGGSQAVDSRLYGPCPDAAVRARAFLRLPRTSGRSFKPSETTERGR